MSGNASWHERFRPPVVSDKGFGDVANSKPNSRESTLLPTCRQASPSACAPCCPTSGSHAGALIRATPEKLANLATTGNIEQRSSLYAACAFRSRFATVAAPHPLYVFPHDALLGLPAHWARQTGSSGQGLTVKCRCYATLRLFARRRMKDAASLLHRAPVSMPCIHDSVLRARAPGRSHVVVFAQFD